MKLILSILLTLFFSSHIYATSCCGEISDSAKKLLSIYDQSNVENLWKNGIHVNWETGEADKDPNYKGPDIHSHCSAFVSAISIKANIFILRPPEHAETYLASAQAKWLRDQIKDKSTGWIKLENMKAAQIAANQGNFVVAVFESPIANKPGHIALVRASDKSDDELKNNGPQIIQAGKYNYNSTTLREGFKNHKNAFPDLIEFYSHNY